MKEEIKQKVLQEAKKRLIRSPFDIYHDLNHHIEVFNNCKEIIKSELLEVDLDLLQIACFWHDVFKGNDSEDSELAKALLSIGLDKTDVRHTILIISEHSFGKEQTLEESRVLYDGDKIELVSINRWKTAIDAYEKGEITLEQRDRYIKEWNRRMPLILGKLHFRTSNEIFDFRYGEFKKWLKSIGRMDENDQILSGIIL